MHNKCAQPNPCKYYKIMIRICPFMYTYSCQANTTTSTTIIPLIVLTQEKTEIMSKQVAGNYKVLFASFHESINFMKNME